MNRRASLYDRVLDKLARSSPGPLAGVIDLLRPSLARGFGGPFNGQERRIELVRELFDLVSFRVIIETGTYRATTTRFLRRLSRAAAIATIETDARYVHYARMRLLGQHVTVIQGDSPTVLASLAGEEPWRRGPAFFYLDAHWLEALPLPAELEVIANRWSDFAILVDDFRVPGDPGYGYDDYGPGRALEPSILASLIGKGVVVYWPSADSTAETGARRGSVLLASAGAVDRSLRSVGGVRRAGEFATLLGTALSSRDQP